ncbi:MAG: site-specific tyrosine recombinase XerD [Propionibacteriaceae bacterium]|nr:site-specific tyrosine recombinase XerD [Propionibacteriaceae bacterium]
MKDYLSHLEAERGLAAATITAYRHDLGLYLHHLAAHQVAAPADVSEAVAASFATSLRASGLKAASIARSVVAVRGLHRFWAGEGLTPDDPARDLEPPPVGRRLPKALTVTEVEAVIAATGASLPGAGAAELRDAALVELLYGTGARVSEAVALDVDDISRVLADLSVGLRLLGKGGRERVVPVGQFARSALEAWLTRGRPDLSSHGSGGPALFLNARGQRLSRQSAFNRLQLLADRAGLDRRLSPHALRHSYATHLIDGGADVRVVQELLGHASVATTQVYTLITAEHLREVYRTSHPRAL